ncbi:MarR family winged helix-turn-helix transcriptional regulator [Gorillibacterium massiliense]|uniref:MarR family winged helix-turn-helix transcriptional regulator n=1 Tax=Gorillibacterium massiliense TaxID=1280390 RepID=UPI0004BBF45D|nr:MarR family transcriptional regulator [Gorillibacterium massiliense]
MHDTNHTVAGEVYKSFFAVTKQLKQLSHQSAGEIGLTMSQMVILNHVRSQPGLTQKAVTEHLLFSKSRVSIHIDVLVEKGLVIREIPETDRRETKLILTPEGEALCERYNKEALPFTALQAALQAFSQDEIDRMLELHRRLLSNLRS